MFSQNLTLGEFVCPIPICQLEADLGSILHIFHQTGGDRVAVLRENNNWGIISSSKLLALLANPKQRLSTVVSGHPRKTLNSRYFTLEADRAELGHLIEPAFIYRDDTKIPKFLESLADNYLADERQNCLIVDNAGKLKGRLNRQKLLRYIGSRVARCNSNSLLPVSLMPLLSLLDHLTLPLKIETSDRKNCYANRCWQKLISRNRNNHLSESQVSNVSIANWWMEQKLAATQKKPDADRFCCLKDKPILKKASQDVTSILRHNSSQMSDRDSAANSSAKQPQLEYSPDLTKTLSGDYSTDRISRSFLDIKVEAGVDWNYLKIPLTAEDGEQLTLEESSADRTTYWLILAIKPSLLQFSDRQSQNCDSVVNKLTVNSLLKTIGHELKSPLTGILGLSNLLDSQKIGELNQRQAEYIKLIHNSGQELMTIVYGLIELTDLTTGKFKLKPEKIELDDLLRQLYQQTIVKLQVIDSVASDLSIEPSAIFDRAVSPTKEAGIDRVMTTRCLATSEIKLNIEPGMEIAIADRLRLSSILSHLMLETVKFSGASSIAIEVIVRREGEHTAITIQNKSEHGETSYLEAEDSAGVSQNIGLDLIIAQYLAQTLQGNIQSIYNSTGCVFTLLLPKVDLPIEASLPTKTAANCSSSDKNLTILCLYPEKEAIDSHAASKSDSDFNLKEWVEQDWSDDKNQKFFCQHRIIEADGLEQAHTLARIWQLDVIVLDGERIVDPQQYWLSLQRSQYLSALPIITLDSKTTEAANQVEGLNVYPCLLPAQCRSIQDLMQVIQIAIEQ